MVKLLKPDDSLYKMKLRNAFYIAGAILLIDQLTKLFFQVFLEHGHVNIIGDFFRFSLTYNTGAAFSILKGSNVLLIILTIAIISFLVYYLKKSPGERLPLSFVLGGAVGNLLDRIIYGSVVDFIDIWIWPVFNFADVAITLGVVYLIYGLIKKK